MDFWLPRLPVVCVVLATEAGSVSESNIASEVRVREGKDSKGESPSLGPLTKTGLSYSMVYDLTVDLRREK